MVMLDCENKETILTTLRKRKIRVIENGPDVLLVAHKQRGKVKIGYMNIDYTHRYGIRTFCTFTEGSSYPWFQSNGDDAKIMKGDLAKLLAGKLEEYPLLDLDRLNINW